MPLSNYIPFEHLDGDHRDALYRAIHNTLATELALMTYAQILDGLPICDVAWDRSASQLSRLHPIQDHVTLCPGVLKKTKEIRDRFDMGTLKFDPNLLQTYQSALPSSRIFNLRLIELTAASLHQIGVSLFQLHMRLHNPATSGGSDIESVTLWERPPDNLSRVIPYPTLFAHPYFTAHGQYPDGVADMVGYWAEDRILGGVALFDRSQAWNGNSEPNVYFHPARYEATFRICQLLDEQQEELLRFLLAEIGDPPINCPLPILPSSNNRVRIDPDDAIPVHKVYRDLWEREPLEGPLRRRRKRCVITSFDYPELGDTGELLERLRRFEERKEAERRKETKEKEEAEKRSDSIFWKLTDKYQASQEPNRHITARWEKFPRHAYKGRGYFSTLGDNKEKGSSKFGEPFKKIRRRGRSKRSRRQRHVV